MRRVHSSAESTVVLCCDNATLHQLHFACCTVPLLIGLWVRFGFMASTDYDCMTCGACCCNPNQNREIDYKEYVEVEARDRIRKEPELLDSLTFTNEKGEIHMKLVGANQRCTALGGRVGVEVSCNIYEFRPAGCRRVKPGDAWCRKLRIERGIDKAKSSAKKRRK